jgi:RNA polymerase sigma factor (sigma-70 family)
MPDNSARTYGREQMWRQVLREYDRRLRRYLSRAHRADSDVDDIISEVWTRALCRENALHQANWAWCAVHPILREVRAEHARTERREVPVDPAWFDQREYDLASGDCASAPEVRDWVMWMLTRLPGQQRRVLQLRYLLGRSFREVAAAIGTEETTARVHALRGLKRLRELALTDPPPRD